jgi:hypothetical protein
MSKVFMISTERLKTNTAINKNVDDAELRSAIIISQDISLTEALGTNLFNKMEDLIESGDIDLSGNSEYKTLLIDYIQPYLTQQAYYFSLDNFIMKFMNVGLQAPFTEQSGGIDVSLYKMMKNNAKNTAEFYQSRLRQYLCDKGGNVFPEYTENVVDGGVPAGKGRGYSVNIVMPSPMYKKGKDGGIYNYNERIW